MSTHFSHRTSSEFTSTTRDVSLGFSERDMLIAKMLVRKMVRAGIRKPPNELLVISDLAYEQWLREEAVSLLREQKAFRQRVIAEIH